MKKYLFLLITAGLFTIPAYSDSFYFLGSYVNPQGDSDIFLQNEIETDFETSDLNGFGVTFGYDHFIGEFVNIGGAVGYYQGRETVADSDFVFENGANPERYSASNSSAGSKLQRSAFGTGSRCHSLYWRWDWSLFLAIRRNWGFCN
jgi:hypothetical protein